MIVSKGLLFQIILMTICFTFGIGMMIGSGNIGGIISVISGIIILILTINWFSNDIKLALETKDEVIKYE